MNVKCTDDLICGLTKEKEYVVTNLFIRDTINFYGLIDNYGVYNEYRANRFIITSEEKIDFLTVHNDLIISIKLS